ncbi:MAG: ABC transporter permease [Desulfohalobiaceae bacterium]|nr:ABC transporter permease [Desulfohalobiaceae bacterium]
MPVLPRLRSKVLFLGSILGLTVLWPFAFLIFRANRIAPGEGLSLFQAVPWPAWLGLILFWGYFLLRSFAGSERIRTLELVPAALAPSCLLFIVGESATEILSQAQPYARVSMGPGVWISLIAFFILLVALYSRTGSGRGVYIPLGVGAALALWVLASGQLKDLSLVTELIQRRERFVSELVNHLWITGLSVGLSTLAGVPLGFIVFRRAWLRDKTFYILNIVQTIPSLALFGLLIAPLAMLITAVPLLKELGLRGIGWTPAIIALTLYAMLPIVRNTYAGFAAVEPELAEAGRGMGMNRVQLLFLVELPRALPILLSGLRIACVQNVGNTAVAALIGAGGLGVFIFQGLGQSALDLIMLGAVPTILLAVGVDALFQLLIRLATPRGLR